MRDNKGKYCRKHGLTGTRLHNIWRGMKGRCYMKGHGEYKHYGAKGITVCPEWLGQNGAENFAKWAIENGYQDNLTLDRKESTKGYSPDNCRWVTQKVQQNNRGNNHLITYDGETLTAAQFAEKYNMNYSTLITRLHRGWDIEKIMNKHSRKSTP